MGAMPSPPRGVRVRIDKQGRLVVPHALRDGLVTATGELLLVPTAEGLLLRPIVESGTVRIADDGLPVLALEGTVTNAEVLASIDRARAER